MPILNAPERIGALIGNRYELREAVGEGASAVLYAAMDRTLEREVGVKVMRRTGALSTGQERKRFRREAQTLARLRHPHLVEVYDVGETADGVPYVVMELLRGETLAARLERSPRLSASEALAITLPLMGALACAHDLGVIHRDIKPANIFLARRGSDAIFPKLLDFGIAKLADEPAMTSDGMTLGTPAFMAPEQARGEPLHPSADVWAMGVTLFACLAGRLPFEAPTAAGVILQATRHGTPRLEAPGLDRAIALAIEKTLALDVQHRMPNMRLLARALVQTARRASVTLPVDPDPVGLPEFAAWCGATANESATDELAVSAMESLASVRKPATSRAADSSSALVALKEQRRRMVRRMAAPVAALAAVAAMALWFGRAEELHSTPAPVSAASGTPGSVVTPVLVEPVVPVEARPVQPASDAPLAQEPRDAGPGESATPPRKARARAKPRPAAEPVTAPVPDPSALARPPLKAWDF